jgi:hypothetical protein
MIIAHCPTCNRTDAHVSARWDGRRQRDCNRCRGVRDRARARAKTPAAPELVRVARPISCNVCYDLPNRRERGRPCACGQWWEPDVYQVEVSSHPSALARVMANGAFEVS